MTSWIEIPEPDRIRMQALVREGRMLSAWKLAEPFGPLTQWAPGANRQLASWIASGVGAERLSSAMDWLNWRADRQHHRAYFHALFARLRWRPPILLLPEICDRLAQFGCSMPGDVRADLLSFKAWALGTLRDFSHATAAMREALAITPQRSWVHVQHAMLLVMQDRYAEALETARQALVLRPVYRPAVMQVTDCLVHLGLDDEAIQLLRGTHQRTENGSYAVRLQAFYSEREDYQNGLWCLDEAEPLMPLMPKSTREWLAGRRADFHYMAGDIDASLDWCDRTAADSFQQAIANNLRRPEARARARKRLTVPFTRQHNMTCAPATLASLAKYWNRDHDHLEIANAICHDGTPWHKERAWAEANGFIAREFRFTQEILIDLIDRGIPFTLTTSWVTTAHLQACIGYDNRQQVALLRDPTHRHFGEALISGLIKDQATQGPRCMLLLPLEEAHRLTGLNLPDETIYEAQHQLAVAIDQHDSWAAQTAVSTLRAINPEHPVTLTCEANLAHYLGHYAKKLTLITRLTERFPNHQPTRYRLLDAYRTAEDRNAARELLERAVGSRNCDPVFVSELGEWLLTDARQLPLAGHFLRRAMRLRPSEGRVIESCSRYELKAGRFDEAARLARYAATLNPTWEPYARSYFDIHRLLGRTQDALAFLRERIDLHGAKSAAPWLTLAQALDSIHRDHEARDLLQEALACLPDHGDLKLQAGRMMICWGEANRATGLKWIEQARGKVAETVWLRSRANTAEFLGDRPLAISLWKKLITCQPQAIDAHRSLAVLLAEEAGRQSAVDFIQLAARRNPRLPGFWILLAEWSDSKTPGSALPALDQALHLDPDNDWILRERATVRFEAGLRSQALEDAREAIIRAPRTAESHGVLATLLHRSGRQSEALAALRDALRLNVDYSYGIHQLVAWSPDPATAREALAFIANEMRRQVLTGDCLLDYQEVAASILPPPVLLDQLRLIGEERPDLWQVWVARIAQCLAMDQALEARQCSDHLARAFPLLSRSWIEVAKVERAAGRHDQEAIALQRAVELSPAWDWAARQLGEVLERLGRYDEALATLELAIRQHPLVVANHGSLASLLYKTGKRDEAITRLLAALRQNPVFGWGWLALVDWCREANRHDEVIAALQDASLRHAHQTQWWTIAVAAWAALNRHEDAVAAARTGLELDPDHANLRDQLARLLGELGRFEEALAACQNQPGDTPATKELEGRRAWLLMESGKTLAALQAMESLLEREPDYAWGWQALTQWHAARNDWKPAQRAGTQWSRLSPDDSTAHGYVGLAARELEDPATAQRAFERAFRLDPAYTFAGRELLRLQTAQDDLSAARATLATLRHYTPGEWIECDAVALMLKAGEDALPAAEALLCSATSPAILLQLNQHMLRPCREASSRWRKRVAELVATGRADSPPALSAWADLSKHEITRAAKRLRRFKIPEASRNAAWDSLLRAARAIRNKDLLDQLIRKNRRRFIEDPMLWNTTGELLLEMGQSRESAKWLGDWQRRSVGVGSHTLVNLTSALDGTAGPQAAAAVRAEGIRRFPASDDNVIYLMAGQAACDAAANRLDEARVLVAMVDDRRISDYFIGLAAIARSILAAADQDEEASRQHYKTALAKLGVWPKDPAVIHHLRPAQQTLARILPWASNKRRRLIRTWGGLSQPFNLKRALIGTLVIALIIVAFVFTLTTASGQAAPFIIAAMLLARMLSKNT